MIRFADPYFLLLIIPLIPLVFFSKYSGGKIKFSNLTVLNQLIKKRRFHPRDFLKVFRLIALILFIFALARPQSGKKFTEVNSEGVDIILVLDTSGSMKALDFKLDNKRVERLDVVKNVVEDFVKKRPGDRLGLIVFGEDAYTQCPLTLDHGIVLDFLKNIEIGMAGNATAIGSAIGIGVKRIKDLKTKSKIMIVLTDGRNTAGSLAPEKAAEIAATFGIKIYTIGVGTKGPAPFKQQGFFGDRLVYQNVDLDETSLKAIASSTDGLYFRATDTKELENIYKEIDRLEKTKVKINEYTEYNELFYYFVFLGLLFLLFELVLDQTRLKKIP